ncbi:MAG: hypothetical protein V3W41_03680 [Planctomycetota bacterium]
MNEHKNSTRPDDAQDRAADKLIDAALAWTLRGESPGQPAPRAVEKKSPRRNIPWSGLAAAAVVLLVIGAFVWRESGWGQEAAHEDQNAATNVAFDSGEEDGTLSPPVYLRNPAAIVGLAPATKFLRVYGQKFADPELKQIVDRCPELESLVLSGSYVTDRGLEPLARLERLIDLSLAQCPVMTDAGLEVVTRLPQLRRLDLTGFVGQTASIQFEGAQGEEPEYVMPGSKLSDQGLRKLLNMGQLMSLDISGTQASGPTISALIQGLPNLRSLGLNHLRFSAADLAPLANHAALWRLASGGISSEDGTELIAAMAATPNLRHLEVGGDGFTPLTIQGEALSALRSLESLQTLRLTYVDGPDDEGWAQLGGLTGLSELSLNNCVGLGRASFEAILRLPKLSSLRLMGIHLEDRSSLGALAHSSSLRSLDLRATDAARDGQVLAQIWKAHEGKLRIQGAEGQPWSLPYLYLSVMSPQSWNALNSACVVLDDSNRVCGFGEHVYREQVDKNWPQFSVPLGETGNYRVRSFSPRHRIDERQINAANHEVIRRTIEPTLTNIKELKVVVELRLAIAKNLSQNQVCVVAMNGGADGTVVGVLRHFPGAARNPDSVRRHHFGLVSTVDTYLIFVEGREPRVMTLPEITACEHRIEIK